ncbi:MAG: hypothetical protein RL662_561 [Bacteroidota bacterium]|jgi:hypothetical protein
MRIRLFFLSILVVCTSLLFIQCSSEQSKIHKQLKLEVDETNRNAPTELSNLIRFDRCILKDNNDLENQFTYTGTTAALESFYKDIETHVKETTKNNRGMEDIRSYGINVKYVYKDQSGNIVYTFEVTPADYK